MFRSYIKSRELHFHGRDIHRLALPFEWGTELLRLPSNGNAVVALKEFAAETLRQSTDFYKSPPLTQYSYELGILKFESAIETDWQENNTVWGRVFEASDDLGVIVLPQWNCDWEGHVQLCRLLQRAGITSVRLSMPYHHFRMPAHLRRPEYMVSPNLAQTIQAGQQAVVDARRAADWLQSRGCKKLAIIGTSLGSCIAFLAFVHDERFAAGTFIHVSGYFADVVWRGLSTQHVRQSLEGRVSLEDLRQIWSPISPFPFIEHLAGTTRRIQMFAGRYDMSFLPDLSQDAFDEFKRCNVPHQLKWLSCGHYTMGKFPFNALIAHNVLGFMRRERG